MSGSSDPVAIPEAPGEDTGNWSVSELMTVSLARELRDGGVTGMGTASALSPAGCRRPPSPPEPPSAAPPIRPHAVRIGRSRLQ